MSSASANSVLARAICPLLGDLPVSPVSGWIIYLSVIACMALLLFWQIGDIKLVTTVLGGIMATLAVLAVAAYLLILVLNRLRPDAESVSFSTRSGMLSVV